MKMKLLSYGCGMGKRLKKTYNKAFNAGRQNATRFVNRLTRRYAVCINLETT